VTWSGSGGCCTGSDCRTCCGAFGGGGGGVGGVGGDDDEEGEKEGDDSTAWGPSAFSEVGGLSGGRVALRTTFVSPVDTGLVFRASVNELVITTLTSALPLPGRGSTNDTRFGAAFGFVR
jgi:hypothetical protein